MTYAVISDVHSNLEALKAVLKELKKRHIHDIYFLGDSVGYGPEPDECIELIKAECKDLLAGNHDWGVCGLTDINFFNLYAKTAIEWTKKIIKEQNMEILESFPLKLSVQNEDITLVHSSPYEPEQWHYLMSISDAELNFKHFETELCFIGHSHTPFIVEMIPSGEMNTYKESVFIRPECRYIINVGSTGQPRDGDPRASYAVVEGSRLVINRVSYDILKTQRKMLEAGLPLPLVERLSIGM